MTTATAGVTAGAGVGVGVGTAVFTGMANRAARASIFFCRSGSLEEVIVEIIAPAGAGADAADCVAGCVAGCVVVLAPLNGPAGPTPAEGAAAGFCCCWGEVDSAVGAGVEGVAGAGVALLPNKELLLLEDEPKMDVNAAAGFDPKLVALVLPNCPNEEVVPAVPVLHGFLAAVVPAAGD